MRKMFTGLCMVSAVGAYAQTREISGQILDRDTKEPLVGATVFISPDEKGVTDYNPQGVIADYDGNFTFTLPKSVKQVVVSYLGYEAITVDISKKAHHSIFLAPSVNELQDIVVTGYQKIEKRKLTSAITKVDMSEVQQIGTPSVDQMLQGAVAGVVAVSTNGTPGGASKIRIRGTASLNGTQDPLWVIDGMPLEGNEAPATDSENIDNLTNTSIAGLNPDDIADITILKDAAATAIYGARAANGVIVVTTKKGKQGKAKVNFSGATFITTKPDFARLNLMNASEKVDFELNMATRKDYDYYRKNRGEVMRVLNKYQALDTYRNGGFDALNASAQQEINALRTSGDNWFDEIYQTSINQQYSLNISGGSEVVTYYVSAGYYDEQGTTKGTGFNRFNLTSNLDLKLSKNLNFGIQILGNQSKRSSYLTDTDAFTNPANYTRSVNPYLNVYNADGSYAYDPDVDSSNDITPDFNFIEESTNSNYQLKNTSLKSIFTLDYKVIPGLKLSTQFGLQLDKSETEKMAQAETYFSRYYKLKSEYTENGVKKYFLPDGGVIQNWNDDFFQYNWKAQAEFNRTFAEKHDLDVMAGAELRSNKSTNIHTKGFGYDHLKLTTKPVNYPSSWTEVPSRFVQYRKSFLENAYASYFGTASYTYDNRYTVFGSIRFDGTNLYGVDPKYRYLPLWAVSGAWNINREEFMRNIDWLDNLKLRVSYGLQGNADQSTSPYVKGTWDEVTLLPGGTNEPGITVTSPPNATLRWEKTATSNVGIDLSVLRNRINLTVEGYYRKSTDLIGMKPLQQENGFEFTNMNWATVTNKGYEISLSTVNIRTRDFTWSTDFNFSQNISKVNKINTRNDSYTPSNEGYPVNAVFALPVAGMDEYGVPMFWKDGEKVSYSDFFALVPGAFGIGSKTSLTPEEYRNLYKYVGDGDPKFSGGFNNKFRYKAFDLSISTSFNLKQTVKASMPYNSTRIDRGVNFTRTILDAWTPWNTNGTLPGFFRDDTKTATGMEFEFMDTDPGQSARHYDIWVKDISYLRINSIRLGYTIPSNILKDKFISSARFSLEARNPFVFGTNYDGYFDPETYGNIYAQPIPKSFSIGVNLSF